jgi:uncharacterized protein (TIGR02246 family)
MKNEVPAAALGLLKDWSIWLVSLQTGALGVASFIVGKGTAFSLNRAWLNLALLFFALSIVAATFVLAALPDIALRMADIASGSSAAEAVSIYWLPLFNQGRWSPFSHTPLWYYTLAEHVCFVVGLGCVVLAGVAAGGDSTSEPRMTDDERAIRDLVATWMAASQAGDVATVLGLMADDAVFMVPGREPFGKEAFATASQSMKDVRFEGSYDIREIKVLGDWAYLRNCITVTMTPPGGEPVRRAGYTLSILHKQPDGKWVLARVANLVMKIS